ncbi:hypothetical protein LJC24_00885 [Desulfococcaceae bacterium OttesenSCG-928-F15]|nr:hypothetical protein [Desulfococcaceae bacterium OttesenSCG-928-F15]
MCQRDEKIQGLPQGGRIEAYLTEFKQNPYLHFKNQKGGGSLPEEKTKKNPNLEIPQSASPTAPFDKGAIKPRTDFPAFWEGWGEGRNSDLARHLSKSAFPHQGLTARLLPEGEAKNLRVRRF